jgi:hypothetical protein
LKEVLSICIVRSASSIFKKSEELANKKRTIFNSCSLMGGQNLHGPFHVLYIILKAYSPEGYPLLEGHDSGGLKD